jgi:hypothetical protein
VFPGAPASPWQGRITFWRHFAHPSALSDDWRFHSAVIKQSRSPLKCGIWKSQQKLAWDAQKASHTLKKLRDSHATFKKHLAPCWSRLRLHHSGHRIRLYSRFGAIFSRSANIMFLERATPGSPSPMRTHFLMLERPAAEALAVYCGKMVSAIAQVFP